MELKDYKAIGYGITDEILSFQNGEDITTDSVGMIDFLDYIPALQTLQFWSLPAKTGTQYTVQSQGIIPDTNKILVKDITRGLCIKGDSIPVTVYASYTGFLSPIRAFELEQSYFCTDIIIPLGSISGLLADNQTYVQGWKYPRKTAREDFQVMVSYPPSGGTCTIYVQNDLAGTNIVTLTIQSGQYFSDPVSDILEIPVTGELVVKSGIVNGAGVGFLRMRKGIARI